jgi:hypothetical protein
MLGMLATIHSKVFSSCVAKLKAEGLIYTLILHVALYVCATWFNTLREELRLRAFENRVLREILQTKERRNSG